MLACTKGAKLTCLAQFHRCSSLLCYTLCRFSCTSAVFTELLWSLLITAAHAPYRNHLLGAFQIVCCPAIFGTYEGWETLSVTRWRRASGRSSAAAHHPRRGIDSIRVKMHERTINWDCRILFRRPSISSCSTAELHYSICVWSCYSMYSCLGVTNNNNVTSGSSVIWFNLLFVKEVCNCRVCRFIIHSIFFNSRSLYHHPYIILLFFLL
jgi:hypothetical protein